MSDKPARNSSNSRKKHDEIIVSQCSEIGPYLKRKITNEWEGFKDYLGHEKYLCGRRMKNCGKCCKSKNDGSDYEDSDVNDDPVISKVELMSSIAATKKYINASRTYYKGVVHDSLLHYLNEVIKNKNKEKVDVKFVDNLLREGVDVNYKDNKGETVLFKAVKYEFIELVQDLLKNKADVTVVNKYDFNVFHATATNKETEIIRILVKEFQIIGQNKLKSDLLAATTKFQQQTPLHLAAKNGSSAIVEYLISELQVDKEALDRRGRSALFLAAEYNKKEVVKVMIQLGCCISFNEETRYNREDRAALVDQSGHSALYWITTKMPDIAKDALDELYTPNPYLRKNDYYLTPLEPKLNREKHKKFTPKSVLMSLVETENLDLLTHPVILCLINFKWKEFGRTSAWIDFLLTIVYVAVWITFALWLPYNKRYNYDFSTDADRFRLSLFIIGILFTAYYIGAELYQIYAEYKYQKESNEYRQNELNEEKKLTKDEEEECDHIHEEEIIIKRNNVFRLFYNYITDFWNIFDWISIILLLACIGSHIDDIVNHSEIKARNHIRIMSATIIVIPLRLLKVSRLIIPKFGTLVMILYYVMADIAIWFLLYVVVWLPFTCAFWMIFGGVRFYQGVNEDGICEDVSDTQFNELHNCTTVSVSGFEQYDLTAYRLYRLTFGNGLDESNMSLVDTAMMNPLIGVYIGFTSLVLVNIFIALLSSTFGRVFERANAFIVLQRASGIIANERSMNYDQRKYHIKRIKKECNPYTHDEYGITITSFEEKVDTLEQNMNGQERTINTMMSYIENMDRKSDEKDLEGKVNALRAEIQDLKDMFVNFANNQTTMLFERSRTEDRKSPQIDYLRLQD